MAFIVKYIFFKYQISYCYCSKYSLLFYMTAFAYVETNITSCICRCVKISFLSATCDDPLWCCCLFLQWVESLLFSKLSPFNAFDVCWSISCGLICDVSSQWNCAFYLFNCVYCLIVLVQKCCVCSPSVIFRASLIVTITWR